mgnify:CR=1 FL=1
MNIGAISPQALQIALADLRRAQTTIAGAGQPGGGAAQIASFQETLAAQISGQATAAFGSQVPAAAGGVSASSGAGGVVNQMVRDTQERQASARQAVQGVVQGEGNSLHGAMIAMEEAGVSFQLLVEMRNKIVESLQELMRMQI